jgi:hypothetical protein
VGIAVLALLLAAPAESIAAQNSVSETRETVDWRPTPWQKDPRPWRQQAQEAGLQEAEIQRLERDGLVVAGPTLLQSFEPYIGASLPVFVTADAVLNAFHVLLEQSLVGVEHAHARRLKTLVHGLRDGLDRPPVTIAGRPELTKTAVRRARLVLGVALALMGEPPRVLVGERALVAQEVARVKAAIAVFKPTWLGPPDAGFLAIDYSRFRPRGFHAGDPVLERAFRAREWLQSLPLRPDRDEELLMFAILHEIGQHNVSHRSSPTDSAGLLGPEDDVAALSFNDGTHADGPSDLDYLRERYTRERALTPISDQIRSGSPERTLRILSTSRIPDSKIFARDPSRQTLPSGLEMAAALGSPVAASGIDGGAQLLGSLRGPDALRNLGEYGPYLEALAALLDPPDPDAPAVFGSKSWQAKSCGTVLAGWAQMRHSLLSHVRESYTIGGIGIMPSGFVEPNPIFFSRLATLAETLQSSLEWAGAFGVEPSQLAAELRQQVGWLEAVMRRQDDRLTRMGIAALVESLRNVGERLPDRRPAILLAQARQLLARPYDKTGPVGDRRDLRDFWFRLALVSRRLEALAHAQLRNRTPSDSDETFLKQIGEELAHIMLYVSNTYEDPRDEAPRIVDVATDPARGLHLEVGIARPRTLYLLYPWQGRDVLTQGAFLPYREFASPRRLTNEEWRKQLDQGGPPATACTNPIELPPRPKP